jgi:hypothetical protein
MTRLAVIAAIAVAFTLVLPAQAPPVLHPDAWCGTSPGLDRRRAEFERGFLAWRERLRGVGKERAAQAPPARLEGGLIVVEDDGSLATPSRLWPFEAYTALRLTPNSAGSFDVSGVPYEHFSNRAELIAQPGGFAHTAIGFAFPFAGRDHDTLIVTARGCVFFAEEYSSPSTSYTLASALSDAAPRLCPAWEAPAFSFGLPVFLTREEKRTVIDWNGEFQLILHSGGAAVFNYARRRTTAPGVVMAVTGRETGLSASTRAARADDAGRTTGGLLDFAELHQLGDTGLFRARFRFLKPAAEAISSSAIFSVSFDEPSAAATQVLVTSSGAQGYARMAGEAGGYVSGSTVELAGHEITFLVPAFDAPLSLASIPIAFGFESPAGTFTVRTSAPLRILRPLRFQPSHAPAPSSTLPLVYDAADGALILSAVRNTASPLAGPAWDALAIYSAHPQDLGAAAAYAARRLACTFGSCVHESLLAMNSIRRTPLDFDNPATYQSLNHEFAHNWLFSVLADDFGMMTKILNPVSPHPAAYVHTPSAFPTEEPPPGEPPWQSSSMGGAWWVHQGFGVYTTGTSNRRPGFGYSWLDLWLMGLASPEEVPEFFYILELPPVLPREYWPPPQASALGVAMPLTPAKVQRDPGYMTAPPIQPGQEMYVPFVLVEQRGRPDPEAVVLAQLLQSNWPRHWSAAVGGRAGLRTSPPRADSAAPVFVLPVAGAGQLLAGAKPRRLRKPFVAKVVDAEGRPAAGVEVRWSVTQGKASLSAESSTSGANGLAYVYATLESSAIEVSASAGGIGMAAGFDARLSPVSATLVAGGGQVALTGQVLPQTFTVLLTDELGNPVPGVELRAIGSNASTPEPAYFSDGEGRVTFSMRAGERPGSAFILLVPSGAWSQASEWLEDIVVAARVE